MANFVSRVPDEVYDWLLKVAMQENTMVANVASKIVTDYAEKITAEEVIKKAKKDYTRIVTLKRIKPPTAKKMFDLVEECNVSLSELIRVILTIAYERENKAKSDNVK